MVASSKHPVFSLEVEGYRPHACHVGGRDWIESNCYIDLYAEVLHALGLRVEACLAFTLASDHEGDQWTFFKPPLGDLKELYGLDVQELTLWRALEDQIAEQVSRGCLVAPEVDAFFLPDVAATDYRQNHVKTTIAVNRIDIPGKRLHYFHNAGYYELGGEDFDGIFGLDGPRAANYLPPYCELLKLERIVLRSDKELLELALRQARCHLEFLPKQNPFVRYSPRFREDVAWLLEGDLARYHSYVFVNLRQCGANFEFAAYFCEWLHAAGGLETLEAASEFRKISQTAKMLILKLARLVRSKKETDLSASIEDMAQAWSRATQSLSSVLR